MKLTHKAISHIRTNKKIRARLQLELKKSEYTINRQVAHNHDNGLLTTAASLMVLREETGLELSELLEETESTALGSLLITS